MSSIIDIIGAMFIGGMLMLIAMNASDTAAREFFNQNSDAITQANLSQISDIIGFDLKKMGFGIAETDTIVFTAEDDHLKFTTHLNSHPDYNINLSGVNYIDQIPDTIEYTISTAETITYGTVSITLFNIHRRIRIPPSVDVSYVVGQSGNSNPFTYLDQMGNATTNISAIANVELQLSAFNSEVVLSPELVMESLDMGDATTQELQERELRLILRPAYWKQTRYSARNLKR